MKIRFEIPVNITGEKDNVDYYFIVRKQLPLALQMVMTLQLRGMDVEHTVVAIHYLEADDEQSRDENRVEVSLANPLGHKEIWKPSLSQRRMLKDAGWKIEDNYDSDFIFSR